MRFVASDELEKGLIVGRDIIFTTQAAVLKKGTTLTDRYIEFLLNKGYMGIYVNDQMSLDIEPEETVDPAIFQAGVEAVRDDSIEEMMSISTDIVNDILGKDSISADLIDLRSFDDYTYHHSVNVAVFSVLVGRKMGLKEKELKNICQAGLCHDLGKSRLPESILNKPDRLTDEEFAEVKKHSEYSHEIISADVNIPAVVKQAVLYHHENENGSGYPHGKEGKDLNIYTKIIHAVDVYDALTSKRPYKDPYEPADAFEYLKGGKGILFNADVVDALVNVIPAYPVGIDVFLSNGKRALVIDNTKDPLRPVIRLYDDKSEINMLTDKAYRTVVISRSAIIPGGGASGNVQALNEQRGSVKSKKRRVMVVDDTPMSLMQARAALEEDYELILLNSGIDAVNYFNENEAPDVVIMDIEMPYVNGVEAMQRIRDAGHKVPVIFLTSVNDRDIIIQCRMLGAADYILKPAKPIYMKERVYQIVHNG